MLLVLLLTLTTTTTTISAVELGGYPSDDWEDVTSSLSVFSNQEMYENNGQRAPSCWACTFVTNQVLAGWTKHAYKLKKWSEEKKTKKAEKALNKACKRITKQQVCLTSDKGFQDFNVLMQSGVISGLNMDSKFGIHLSFCKALVPRLIEHGIAERMSDVIKLFDYNLQREDYISWFYLYYILHIVLKCMYINNIYIYILCTCKVIITRYILHIYF